MNIRDLKYLLALAEHQHFGKAAEACFVTQPTLSMQIKKLEEELQVSLLERNNKMVLLTPVGRQIAERASEILQQIKHLKTIAEQSRDSDGGELQLGIIPTLAPYLLPKIMPEMTKQYPKLKWYLLEEQTDVLLAKLAQGKIDAAILALPVTVPQLVAKPLFTEPFWLAVPKTHPLAKRKRLTEADLQAESLLLLTEGHCLRDQALAVCQQWRLTKTDSFQATSLETLRHMVAAGAGITFIPELAKRANDGLVYLDFPRPKAMRQIGLVWRSTSTRSALLEKIAVTLKKYMQQ